MFALFFRFIFYILGNNNELAIYCRLYVDGPFSSPLQDVLQSPYNVCIAGGIGVTPFASIFSSILYAFWVMKFTSCF